MTPTEATDRLLEAAEELFYAHGVQAVGMDAVRARSGVSLKRLYQTFPAKNDLVEAYLLRRDERWRGSLREFVHARGDDPLAVFAWLKNWFAEPGFRGCAFINSFGEFGEPAPGIAAAIRKHKDHVRAYLRDLGPPGRMSVSSTIVSPCGPVRRWHEPFASSGACPHSVAGVALPPSRVTTAQTLPLCVFSVVEAAAMK